MNYLGTRKSGVEEAPLQDDLMLFEPESSRFFVLNSSMALVWKHCDGQMQLDDAVDALMEQFEGVAREDAMADLSEARSALADLGLIEVETEGIS